MKRNFTAVSAGALLFITTSTAAFAAETARAPQTLDLGTADVEEVLESDLPAGIEFPAAESTEVTNFGDRLLLPNLNDGTTMAVAPQAVLLGVDAAVVVLDKLVNLGKSIWDIVKSGSPTVNIQTDVASVVPQGITDWQEMETWQTPVSKLYKTQLMDSATHSIGDFYFRLMFTPGGSYKGKGKYLATVSIVPAQLAVPYRRAFSAQAKVTGMMNHGTATNPIAGMLLTLQWAVDTTFKHTTQSVTFHIRGDGVVNKYPADNDVPESIDAPAASGPRGASSTSSGYGNPSWYGWPTPHP